MKLPKGQIEAITAWLQPSSVVIMTVLLILPMHCGLEQFGKCVTTEQSICVVVRSTLTHCAGVRTVCGEGAQGTFVESVWCVCMRVGK